MRLYKEDYAELIAITVIIALVVYLRLYPLTERADELTTKRIALSDKLVLRQRGENRQDYIRIKGIFEPTNFDLSECALLKTRTDILLKLDKGDSLTLGTRKTKTYSEKFNDETQVIYITSPKYGQLLKLEDFNSCENKSATITPFIAIGLIAYLIFRIVRRHQKRAE